MRSFAARCAGDDACAGRRRHLEGVDALLGPALARARSSTARPQRARERQQRRRADAQRPANAVELGDAAGRGSAARAFSAVDGGAPTVLTRPWWGRGKWYRARTVPASALPVVVGDGGSPVPVRVSVSTASAPSGIVVGRECAAGAAPTGRRVPAMIARAAAARRPRACVVVAGLARRRLEAWRPRRWSPADDGSPATRRGRQTASVLVRWRGLSTPPSSAKTVTSVTRPEDRSSGAISRPDRSRSSTPSRWCLIEQAFGTTLRRVPPL